MLVSQGRKNRVVLADYNHRRDLENRLLLAQLSAFDVELLIEVLNNSLRVSVEELAHALEASPTEVIASLNRLAPTRLLQHDGRTVTVDKEMRKYYEFQIEKFEEDFAPDLEYIFKTLKRVPIGVLPNWYSIPRTTDDIFVSIIEKCLQTPRLYRRHLEELSLEEPILSQIMQDVFAAQDFKVAAKALCEKYDLSREEFEEYMLILEFNFACFVSYAKINDEWSEVVTPMHEWREFLRFQRDTCAKTLSEGQVRKFHEGGDFAFLSDLTALIRLLDVQPLKVEEGAGHRVTLSPKVLALWSSRFACRDDAAESYMNQLVKRLLQLGLADIREGYLQATPSGNAFSKRQSQEQARLLYRLPILPEDYPTVAAEAFTEKNMRSVERALRRVLTSGWVTFESFMKGMSEPLGESDPVTLRQKGKRWSYAIPTYQESDVAYVKEMIFQRLFQVGIVTVGEVAGKPCFAVTALGRIALGD